MATRSNIGVLNSDGTVDYIYCHWDGYLDYNGRILMENYNDEASAWALIAEGNMSVLGTTLSDCKFYGGKDEEAKRCSYVDFTKEHFEKYVYLFVPGEGWKVRTYGTNFWTDVKKALETIEI